MRKKLGPALRLRLSELELRALLAFGADNESRSIAEVARQLAIPPDHAQAILQALTRRGLVECRVQVAEVQ